MIFKWSRLSVYSHYFRKILYYTCNSLKVNSLHKKKLTCKTQNFNDTIHKFSYIINAATHRYTHMYTRMHRSMNIAFLQVHSILRLYSFILPFLFCGGAYFEIRFLCIVLSVLELLYRPAWLKPRDFSVS